MIHLLWLLKRLFLIVKTLTRRRQVFGSLCNCLSFGLLHAPIQSTFWLQLSDEGPLDAFFGTETTLGVEGNGRMNGLILFKPPAHC